MAWGGRQGGPAPSVEKALNFLYSAVGAGIGALVGGGRGAAIGAGGSGVVGAGTGYAWGSHVASKRAE